MRWRITVSFVAILAVALLIAAGVSLLLVRNAARENARTTVLRQAEALVASARALPAGNSPSSPAAYSALLPLLHSIAGLSSFQILVVDPKGKVSPAPSDLPRGALNTVTLGHSRAVAGTYDSIAFAAAPLVTEPKDLGGKVVALLLTSTINFSSDSVSYFLVAGGISLLVAAALAAAISQRISRRLVAAAGAAQQIAGGDLATRIDVAEKDYPELVALGSSINTMATSLEAARHLERHFLLSISHDLRTPLTSIRGYAEAIADGAVPDAGYAAGIIVSEAGRLERLIGDLLDLARLDTHHFALDASPIDISATIGSAAEALHYEFEASGVELTIAMPEHAFAVGDNDRLRQIVANLVENSLKFAKQSVNVSLEAGDESEVVITVEDDGPGIDPEDLPHIFERLFTSHRHPARAAGTGLGLAIVAELAGAMSGTIEVTSPVTDGEGTRIAVTLPRLDRASSSA